MKTLKNSIVVALSLLAMGSVYASNSTLHSKTYPIMFPDNKMEFKTPNFTVEQHLYKDVIFDVRSMLTKNVGVADWDNGNIKVTDRDEVLDTIDKHLDFVNKQMVRKITFNIKVYKVNGGEAKFLNNSWAVKSGTIADFDNARGVSLISSQDTMTLNYIPVSIQSLKTQNYISQGSIVSNKDSSVVMADVNDITSGISLVMLPKIFTTEDKIQLNIYGTVSDEVEFTKYDVNGGSIELPKFNTRESSQILILNNGESAIWQSIYKGKDSNGYIVVVTPTTYKA